VKLRRVFSLLLIAILISGCTRSSAAKNNPDITGRAETDANPGTLNQEPVQSGPAWPALALLKTGANPLWFEFAEKPCQIASPSDASLADFAPWPLAYHSAGILANGGNLVFAINRGGFLVLKPGPEPGAAVMHYAAEPDSWDEFSVAAVFTYENCPAVLLCRDDFFTAPAVLPPEHPVMSLNEFFPIPEWISVPCMEYLHQKEGWEVNYLRKGPDNNWYYRYYQTGYSTPGIEYYRTKNLSQPGEKISQGEFRNASSPQTPENAGQFPSLALLAAVVNEMSPEINGHPVFRMISEDPSKSGDFSFSSDGEINLLFGFHRDIITFAILPDGRGIACRDGGVFIFTLPALPEHFCYTGAGLAGNVLAASWEEQNEFSIGAAGLMVINAETLGF